MKKLTAALALYFAGALMIPSAAKAQPLYEKAKEEGKVLIYGTGDEQFMTLARAFMKHYPGISVEAQDMRGREARERIMAEEGARQVLADMISGGENSIAELRQSGFLEKYDSADLKFIHKEVLDPLAFRVPYHVNVYGITINTDIVPAGQAPKKWADLVDPRWRGKIAAQDPRGSGGGLYIMTALLRVHGLEFIKKLAGQNIFFGSNNSQLVTGLLRGEHGLLMTTSWQDRALQKALSKKAPLKMLQPEEGVMVIPISLALVKNAPHPSAAALFMNWVITTDAQRVAAEAHYTPVRIGVRAIDPEGNIEGVKLLPTEDWTTKPELVTEMTKRWEEIFFKK
jgi:iron(III) transport system substrate-binding protein